MNSSYRLSLLRSCLAAIGVGWEVVVHGASTDRAKPVPKEPPNLKDVAVWRTKTDEGKRLIAQGRLKEAEECLLEALQAAMRGFGHSMPHVGMSANNVAEVYRVTGKLVQARWLYFQAMECFLGTYGEEDPRSALAMHNYAVALTMIGEHKEAHSMATRAYNAMKGIYGSERSETLQSHYVLARAEWNLKRTWRALAAARDCRRILIEKDVKSVVNGQLACDLLCLMMELKDRPAVLSLWIFIAGVLKEGKEEHLRQIQQICEKLMDAFAQRDYFDQALEVVQHLEAYIKKVRPTENLALVLCLRRQASLQLQHPKGSVNKAMECGKEAFEMAWKLFDRKYRSKEPDLGERVLQLWKRFATDEKRDEEAENVLLFNCIYELTLSAHGLFKCLPRLDDESERGRIMEWSEKCLALFERKGVSKILDQIKERGQFPHKIRAVEEARNELRDALFPSSIPASPNPLETC